MRENYRPTWLNIDDPNLKDNGIYFDTLIIKFNGRVYTLAAWGDGAHVNEIAYQDFEGIHSDNIAYHIDQLASSILRADSVIAVKDHNVIYKRGC